MKQIITALLLVFSVQSFAMVELCPEGQESGTKGCFKADEVLYMGGWVKACCGNVDPPTGYNCVNDDCNAKNGLVVMPHLYDQNNYVEFTQGYNTWVLNNGKVDRDANVNGFTMDTMRAYLPMARLIFMENPDIKSISIQHDSQLKVIIQRPEFDEDLEPEIVFPAKVTANELTDYLDKMDDGLIRLFPNPASDKFTIKSENNIHFSSVEIYSTTGALIHDLELSEPQPEVSMDIKDLEAGSYIVRLYDVYGREFYRNLVKR